MGDKPIIEKSNSQTIPDDGRICLGEDYAHRRVPLELCVPADEDELTEGYDGDHRFTFYSVDKFEADSRGRVTLPAPVRDKYSQVLWIVSEPALEHGGIGEAYEARGIEEGQADE